MTDRKVLAIDAERCTGCNTCMLVCSFAHERVFNYARSRIWVWRDDDKGVFIPVTCEHCEDAPCVAVCPMDALYRDGAGIVQRDQGRCIGCNECMSVCPIGAITRFNGQWRKCDLCSSLGSVPYCAANCTAGALRHVSSSTVAREKAERVARKRGQALEMEA
jgi:Fe-S-cluster-containing hydrogenase component 2